MTFKKPQLQRPVACSAVPTGAVPISMQRYQMKKLALIVIVASLGGCGQRSGAEEAVRNALKDPDSARFGEFYHNSQTNKGCLSVNAKNSLGGFTGYQQAHLEKSQGGWAVSDISDEAWDTCRTYFADAATLTSEEVAVGGRAAVEEAARDAAVEASEAAAAAAAAASEAGMSVSEAVNR